MAQNWFKSYLTNRKQYVSLNGESSELKQIACGVPQGSCLGPLLFLLYINDLPNISEVLHFYLFADDTHIYYKADNMEKLETVINKELRKLGTWLIVNRLSLNIDKTNYLIFHPYNKPLKQRITLKIHKKAISESDYIKYIGIMVDSTLTWNIHIDKISKTISRATGLLYKIRPFVNNKTLKMLYYSLVYPHLNYVTEVWGSADPLYLNRILILQKRIVRMLTSMLTPVWMEGSNIVLKPVYGFFLTYFILDCHPLHFFFSLPEGTQCAECSVSNIRLVADYYYYCYYYYNYNYYLIILLYYH